MECVFAQWTPGIGDPTYMGWATVALYFAASWLSWRRRRSLPRHGVFARERSFWGGLAVVLTFFGLNKQLDFQSAMTAAGRCVALEFDWYASRHSAQIALILALIVFFAAAGSALLWYLRKEAGRLVIPLVGAVCLFLFVLVRAASFHHVDIFISTTIIGVRMNWLIEAGSLAVIIFGAIRPERRRVESKGIAA